MASGDLWCHSATSAVAAQIVAKELGDDLNLVFTAALLHDIGKVIMSDTLDSTYAVLVAETARNGYSLLEVERRILGFDHAEAGARLLAKWSFPANLVAAIEHHHQPDQAGEHVRLAAYAHLGNLIAYGLGHGYGNGAYALEPKECTFRILGIKEDSLPDYMLRTFDQMATIEALFRVK
jgi:putative nucleotidyltransferase with HDIG domain